VWRQNWEGEETMEQAIFEVRDPVCGMELRQDDAEGTSDFEGTTYYFCSTECREKFEENPRLYTAEARDQFAA